MLVDDALRALPLVERFDGPIVDVGSGGGSPGIPLAAALPDREVTLLEAERRKCDFLGRWAPPNARVVWGRAEEQPLEAWGVALGEGARAAAGRGGVVPAARARGGAAMLWLGESADVAAVARAAAQLGGGEPEVHDGIAVLPKVVPTPPGFPRRAGVAKKRPLA